MTDLERLIELFQKFGLDQGLNYDATVALPQGGYFLCERNKRRRLHLVDAYDKYSDCYHEVIFDFKADGSFVEQYIA